MNFQDPVYLLKTKTGRKAERKNKFACQKNRRLTTFSKINPANSAYHTINLPILLLGRNLKYGRFHLWHKYT